MRLLIQITAALLLAVSAKADYELPQVRGADVALPLVMLHHVDYSTTVCYVGDITVHDWTNLNEHGYPTMYLVEGDASNPSTLETEWTDEDGLLHRVRTPCRGRTAAGCAGWHKVQVKAMLAVFPPKRM